MHKVYASELEQNTLSLVCPVLATVVPQLHTFFVFYPDLLSILFEIFKNLEKIKNFEKFKNFEKIKIFEKFKNREKF